MNSIMPPFSKHICCINMNVTFAFLLTLSCLLCDDAVWISKTKHHKLDRLVRQNNFRWPPHIKTLYDGMMKYLFWKMVVQIGVQYCSIYYNIWILSQSLVYWYFLRLKHFQIHNQTTKKYEFYRNIQTFAYPYFIQFFLYMTPVNPLFSYGLIIFRVLN